MKLTAILPMLFFYPFLAAPSSRIHNTTLCYYHWQTYNLIENIIKWHNFDANFWLVVAEGNRNLFDIIMKCAFLSNNKLKMLAQPSIVNFPQTRNFAAIFFTSSDSIENQLNMSLKLPQDVIKIYLNHNGCQLNETNLAEIMNRLWLSREIGFIYYISYCSLSTTSNYDSIDNHREPHKDNYNCAISLFYHHPFVKNKSGQWGVMEKVDLINDRMGVKRQTINMSSQVFHRFPFQRKHTLNLNGLDMTVIFFPSTGAYFKSELEIFHNQLSKEVLDDPFHNLDAYFGYDADVLRELKMQMNFTLHLSPTTDRQSYGFKVSVNT